VLTISAVLTKADTVTEMDSFKRWQNIMSGEEKYHALKHGYFVTMQRQEVSRFSQTPISLNEENFFEQNKFWSSVDVRFKDRFGTDALRRKLAAELSHLIKTRYHTPDSVSHG
jgi:hypothetical protein